MQSTQYEQVHLAQNQLFYLQFPEIENTSMNNSMSKIRYAMCVYYIFLDIVCLAAIPTYVSSPSLADCLHR